MNQLGRNLAFALCVVTALLIILGLKRRLARDGAAPLLSQPAGNFEKTKREPGKDWPRPRVLQAKPLTQQERAFLSPTNSHFADSETETSPATGIPAPPIPIPVPAPQPLEVPDLVPVSEPTPSPVTATVSDAVPAPMPTIESSPVPTAESLPEFVLTGAEDSFWTISERVYGSGVYYRALFRHNEATVLRPDQLSPGIQVRTPPLEVLQERYPADFPRGPSSSP